MKQAFKNVLKKIGKGPLALLLVMAMVIAGATMSLAATTGNLITNPSFETGTGNSATNWTTAKSGSFNSASFSMKTSGSQEGNRSAYVKLSTFLGSSNAYWKPAAVVATPSATYNYSSWYKASVASSVIASIELTDGKTQTITLKNLSASSSAWQQVTASFTAPTNAKKITVYQMITKSGWLQTDNYNLSATTIDIPTPTTPTTPTPNPNPNPTPAPTNMVTNNSIEQGTANSATDWITNSWGSMTAQFTTPAGAAQDGQRTARIDVSSRTSGDAKWMMKAVDAQPNTTYDYSNWYKASVVTQLDIEYTLQDGTKQYAWLKDLPAASAWTKASASFTTPANVKSMIVFQPITQKGWLETDTYSLSTPAPITPTGAFSKPLVSIEFDDGWGSAYRLGLPAVEELGWKPTQYIVTDTAQNNDNYGVGTYMTAAEIKDWNRRADIGSHSVTHRSVPNLTAAEMRGELVNSKTYLDSLLGENTNLYVSPYCESSQAVADIVKTLYQSMRNCEATYNSASNFNRWDLKSFIVLNNTTDAEITALLNQTKANNGWLIIVWHEIAGDNVNDWSVSQATLKRQLQLIKNSGIDVVPTQAGLNQSLGL